MSANIEMGFKKIERRVLIKIPEGSTLIMRATDPLASTIQLLAFTPIYHIV